MMLLSLRQAHRCRQPVKLPCCGDFTNFFVLLPFCSHLKCCQSFFNILVSILFPRSLDFLRFLKRESVSFHFSSPSSLYINSVKLSIFLKSY